MATFTVTATFSGGVTPGGGTIRVTAVNGAKTVSQQTGGTGGATSTTVSYDQSVTVAATGSVVYGAAANFTNNTAFTADAATTFTDNVSFASGDRTGTFRSTNATSSTGALTFGASAPTGTAGSVAVAEILAAAGQTIAEDPSTSSAVTTVTTGSTVTSPSITPPGGCLLVVRVAGVAGTGPSSATITDNSGLNLNWKALKQQGTAGTGANYAGVFIADVPAEPQYKKLFSRNWQRHFKHPVPSNISTAVPIPVIQSVGPVQVASLTGPLTATLPQATGSLGPSTLVACITSNGTTVNPGVGSITLGGSADNWQNAFSDPGTTQYGAMIWYDPNCASGQTSVVLTGSGGSGASSPQLYLTVYEVYGVLAFDKGSSGDSNALVTSFSSGTTAQLSQMNEIAFGVEMNDTLVASVTGAGAWQYVQTGAGFFDQTAGYQQITSGGTATFSGPLGNGARYTAVVASFMPSVASGNVNISGVTANVNVSSQFTNEVPQVFQTFNPQTPFSAVLNSSLRFNPAFTSARPQTTTSYAGVFTATSTGSVSVAGPSGIVTELIDGTGAVANVSVSAPAGNILITQPFNPQAPFPPVLSNSIQFVPSYIALRQQLNTGVPTAPPTPVNINGVVANVNVSGQADNSISIYQNFNTPSPFESVLPSTIRFSPAYQALRVQTSTALPDVFVPGSTANVNVASSGTVTELIDGTGQTAGVTVTAQPGQIQVFQNVNPPFPDSPILPASLRFNPAYTGLRPQYNTGFPGVFETGTTANVNVSGQADNTVTETLTGTTAQVNVSAPAGSFSITQIFNPQTPFPAILPASLKFVPSLEVLRVQSNTGSPVVTGGINGSVSNVNVSGQPDNLVVETLSGAVANVNVVAQPGALLITAPNPPQFFFPSILPEPVRFNPAFIGLRQQFSTSGPDVFVNGSVANVNVSVPAGNTSVIISGTVANVNVAAANDNIVTETLSGTTANVNAVANPGSIPSTTPGTTGTVNVAAIPGSIPQQQTSVAGVTATVVVSAIPGGMTSVFVPNWWRVYKQYPVYPVW